MPLLLLFLLAAPAHAQADMCSKFPSPADQARCRLELTQTPPAQPFCLPMTAQQFRAVQAGYRVRVPGVDGCEQVWN